MTQGPIPKKKLGPIIEELEQLEDEHGGDLHPDEVREVLRDLKVPDARLEQALQNIQAKEAKEAELAKAKQTRTKVFAAGGVAVLVLAVIATGLWYSHSQREVALSKITATDAQLSVANKPAATPVFLRSQNPEIQLDVVLHEAPTGDSLDMRCDWVSPTGQTAYESHYTTKKIDKTNWPTHCKNSFKQSAQPGAWLVRMKVSDRPVIEVPFTIE